jgi:Alpha/beta hydrolase family
VPALRERGHEAVAPELPFDDPGTTFEDRARPAIEALDGAADGVVVGHSLASAYAPLVPAARVIYLCPAPTGLFDARAPMRRTRPGFPFPANDARGLSRWEPAAAIAAMYPRFAPETARALAARLKPGGSPAGDYPLTRHPDVPTALLYAADDEFFEPAWERWAASELLGVEPVEMPGGHFPMLETPDVLADLLVSVAS